MKLTRINTLLVAILISLAAMVKGQTNYPVFVTTTLTPPYSVNLGDYSKFGSQQLLVNIRVNDLTVVNLPVKLQIKIEGVGISIFNLPTINTTPIYLNGGDNTMLSGNDFANYLSVNNLAFKGYSKEIYKRTGQIPDGFYRFSITVLHYSTNRIISNEASYSAWIVAGKPVNLLKPTDKEIVGDNDGVPILFSWEPSLVGSPAAKGNIQYKFEMWEMRIKGVNPYTIAASMPAVHEYTTFGTTYLLNPAGLLMEPTMQYCWRVTASDITGNVFFEKDGKSEVRVFTYQSPCDAVTQLTGKAISTTAVFQWVPQMNHTAFITHILNPQTGWESTSETYDSKVQFYDLEPGSTYQLKVQSVCGSTYQRKSRYSNIAEVTINPQRAIIDTACPDCSCNDVLPKKIANTQLRNNVAAGDIITNKSGRTRFVIHSVEQTAPDTYRGVLYFWSEIWGVKIACNYTNLQVNTDNIAVNLKFESIDNPGFVLDVAKAQTLAAAVSNTIKEKLPDKGDFDDTLKVDYNIAAIYINENNEIVAVSADANGTVSESVLNVNQLEHDVLITDKNGQQLVATTGGTIMSNNVYQATKGNAAKVSEYNKKQETENTGSPVVKFSLAPNQLYGFDEYNSQKQRIAIQYPVLTAGYIPPYKSISGFGSDYAIVNNSKNIEFRNELGVPVMCNNGTITVRGNAGGSQGAVYAYAKGDSTNKIIGKLNIQSYDLQTKKVVIVPVNNAAVPLQSELKNTLNTIFKQAVTDWEVSVAEPLNNITFAGGKYTHGGSSSVSTYNTDQKSITRMFESQYGKPDKNTFYLFYLSASDINPTNVIGYMPLKRQIGFIYGSPTLSTVAHELCHGAFNLYHTFSSDNNIAPKGTTKNLMDYNEGSELWKYQWDLIHDPQTMLFSFLQDEEEGAAIQNLADGNYYSISENKWENYAFLSPIGTAINITGATDVKFNEDGAVLNFKKDGKTYYGVHSVGTQRFVGYLSQDDKNILNEHSLLTVEFETEFNQKKYTGITYAAKDKEVIAYFKQKDGENYLDCLRKATWKNKTVAINYTGIANPPFIPDDAVSLDISGNQCVNYAAEGVHDGVGKDIFINLKNVITEEQKPKLVELANYFTDSISNKKFAFYGYGLEDYYSSGVFNEQIILYLKNNKIYSKGLLKQKFPYIITQARDFGYIFSNADLWSYSDVNTSLGVPDGYNANSLDYVAKNKGQIKSYEYSFADLRVRKKCLEDGTVIKTAILNFEESGDAEPIAEHEFYGQYVAQFGTDAAYPFIAKTAAEWSKDLLAAYFLNQLAAEYGIMLINEAVKNIGKEAFKKLIKEKGKDFIQGAVIDYGIQATFSYAFDDKTFAEAASPGNINWISVGASGLESTLTINNKYAEYGVAVSFACFVNGWSDAGGFKDDFDVTNCAIGVVGTVLGKQVPLVFKYLKKYASYSVSKLKAGLAKLNITGQQADEIIEKIKNSVDEGGESTIVTAGKLTVKQIDDYVAFATKQNDKIKVMFGMWDGGGSSSYITKAGKDYTYFDFGDKWDEVYDLVNKSDDEIWKINKKFVDNQKAAGKEFWFSHDPFSPKNEQFFAREINYLIDLGVTDFEKVGDLWKAIW